MTSTGPGRPSVYGKNTLVRIAPKRKLPVHSDSSRREVLQQIIDKGGIASLAEISTLRKEPFTRTANTVGALVRAGWLVIHEEGVESC